MSFCLPRVKLCYFFHGHNRNIRHIFTWGACWACEPNVTGWFAFTAKIEFNWLSFCWQISKMTLFVLNTNCVIQSLENKKQRPIHGCYFYTQTCNFLLCLSENYAEQEKISFSTNFVTQHYRQIVTEWGKIWPLFLQLWINLYPITTSGKAITTVTFFETGIFHLCFAPLPSSTS